MFGQRVFSHVFLTCVWSCVLTSAPTHIWHVRDFFWHLVVWLAPLSVAYFCSAWTSAYPHGGSHWRNLWSRITITCFLACLTVCLLADLTLQLLFPQPLSEMSILQLVPSALTFCLFFNPALAVGGRRLLASRISCHFDAVLSVFVSQRAGPRFLVDESRVPLCTGSDSVSFQHPTLLWDGRKSNLLAVSFFPWMLFLRI